MSELELQADATKKQKDYAVVLKKMRLTLGLSRKQAAVLASVSHKYIERLENTRGNLTLKKLK